MHAVLAERGTATACPSEIARRVAPDAWRPLMPAVRAVAARLQDAGAVDAYQHGRPIHVRDARGPIRLRARAVKTLDHRAHPERYVIGRGEQGVLTVEPFKSELLPLWRFRTPALARTSAAALARAFARYRDGYDRIPNRADFVGMDMARKFLQMGWTRARRYANRTDDPDKPRSAEIFRVALDRVRLDPTYVGARAAWPDVMPRKQQKPPWKKPARGRRGATKRLSSSAKKSARSRAKRAGRPYPNLVDNMNAAKSRKGGKSRKQRSRKRS